MSCYLLHHSPIAFMDRRKSYHGESTVQINRHMESSENINIDLKVSPLMKGIFNTNGRLQELNHLDKHWEWEGGGSGRQDSVSVSMTSDRYRSTSSLSSNSGESSRRQSFSSTVSNSCCNNMSETSHENCCGFLTTTTTTKYNQVQGPYNSTRSKRYCASLLRARLLNMSQPDEDPNNSSSTSLSDDHGEGHQSTSLLEGEHDDDEYHKDNYRRRQSWLSLDGSDTGQDEQSTYPCVGPFEKKRRMAHAKRTREIAGSLPNETVISFELRPNHIRSSAEELQGPVTNESGKMSAKQQPINMCKQDEEIALGLAMRMTLHDKMDSDVDMTYPIPGTLFTTDSFDLINSSQPQPSAVLSRYLDSPYSTSYKPGSLHHASKGSLPYTRIIPKQEYFHEPNHGSFASFYGQIQSQYRQSSPALSQKRNSKSVTSISILHPELVTEPELHISESKIPLLSRSMDSESSVLSYYQRSDGQDQQLQQYCSSLSTPRRYLPPNPSPVDHIVENLAAQFVNPNLESEAPEIYPHRRLDDSHSTATIHLQQKDNAKDHVMNNLLNELRNTGLEDSNSGRIVQPQKLTSGQPKNYEHQPFPPYFNLTQIKQEPGTDLEEEGLRKCGKNVSKRGAKKIYQCADCSKNFSQLRNYRYHRSRHEGTDVFQCTCPVCGKNFNDKGYLSSHLKIHANAKEYHCEFCEKSFNQRVAYNMHVRIHTGVKPHVCPEKSCKKAFSRKMLLKQHLRTHTGERPYACSICSKAFADRSNMLLHQKLHSGNRPYKCSQCDKTFSKNHHLKTHMNHHLGIKPYVCPNCPKMFSQSSNMKTHLKRCNCRNKDSNPIKEAKSTKGPSVRAVKSPCPGKAAIAGTSRRKKVLASKSSCPTITGEALFTGEIGRPEFVYFPSASASEDNSSSFDQSYEGRSFSTGSYGRPTVICASHPPSQNQDIAEEDSQGNSPPMSRRKSLQEHYQSPPTSIFLTKPSQMISAPIESAYPPRYTLPDAKVFGNSTADSPINRRSPFPEGSQVQPLVDLMNPFKIPSPLNLTTGPPGQKIKPHYAANALRLNYPLFSQQQIQENHSNKAYRTQLHMLDWYRQITPPHSGDGIEYPQRQRSQSFDYTRLSYAMENQQHSTNSYLVQRKFRSPSFDSADVSVLKLSDLSDHVPEGDMNSLRVRSYSAGQQSRHQQRTERRSRMFDPLSQVAR